MTAPVDLAALADRPTVDTRTAARVLGVSSDALYKAARDGDAPITPIRVGRRLVWPTRPLLDLVGWTPTERPATGVQPGSTPQIRAV